MNKFIDNVLIPLASAIALILFLCLSSKVMAQNVSAVIPTDALRAALHECQLTGTYKTMECATAILRGSDGTYRVTPITVGTEGTFRLHINYQLGDTLVCLFHTHPGKDGNADSFSDLDVRVAEKLEIPSYIYVLRLSQMRVYYPTRRVLAANDVSSSGKAAVIQ